MSYKINPNILNNICNNDQFKFDLSSSFPEIIEYIESFMSDSNCGCKNTILKHLWDNKDSFAFLELRRKYWNLDFIITDSHNDIQVGNQSDQQRLVVNINKGEMFGEVITIPSTKESYRRLIHRAREEKWIFHGFTVTETKRKWKVFFY